MIRFAIPVLLAMALSTAVEAGKLREELPVDTRVREVASKLRCPVCQGESVYDSHAAIALEMKAIISERVEAGYSDEEIVAFFEERYGDYVLMQPRFNEKYAFVWLAPFAVALGAVLLALRRLRMRRADSGSLDGPTEASR